ncbi:MAG TPA: BrnT family toxin [Coxiellaceae bacterium]|nr:BrnT family toxin [Coxiellaceae bacterium]
MRFEWDLYKNQQNEIKHGLSFYDAHLIFAGKTLSFIDDRCDYGEKRLITLGTLMGRLVVIVHVQRGEVVRIISMRKANAREEKIYSQRLKEAG